MIDSASTSPQTPWYRESWPWYLMLGPTVVVIACIYTAWLAITTSDGLVTNDYYKEGLAIEQTLARSHLADTLGLELHVQFSSDGVRAKLLADPISATTQFELPKSLRMSLSHPTRAGLDQQISMDLRDGIYLGKIRLPASGHWLILFEDDVQTWRILGNVQLPALGEVVVGGRTEPAKY